MIWAVLGAAAIVAGPFVAMTLLQPHPAQDCAGRGGAWNRQEETCLTDPQAPGDRGVIGAVGIARALDVTSFASGLDGPSGARTLSEHGFTQVLRTSGGVELYAADQARSVAITVLEDSEASKLICFVRSDPARGVRRAMTLRAGRGVARLWTAIEAPPHTACV